MATYTASLGETKGYKHECAHVSDQHYKGGTMLASFRGQSDKLSYYSLQNITYLIWAAQPLCEVCISSFLSILTPEQISLNDLLKLS